MNKIAYLEGYLFKEADTMDDARAFMEGERRSAPVKKGPVTKKEPLPIMKDLDAFHEGKKPALQIEKERKAELAALKRQLRGLKGSATRSKNKALDLAEQLGIANDEREASERIRAAEEAAAKASKSAPVSAATSQKDADIADQFKRLDLNKIIARNQAAREAETAAAAKNIPVTELVKDTETGAKGAEEALDAMGYLKKYGPIGAGVAGAGGLTLLLANALSKDKEPEPSYQDYAA